jgi:hypothetical protein
MESSGGKGRLTLARGDSRFNGSKTLEVVAVTFMIACSCVNGEARTMRFSIP